jgi:hypothetical protein
MGIVFSECTTRDCLDDAARGCIATHFFEGKFTVEGTPAFFDYFVVPRQAAEARVCEVVLLADYSSDYWGRCSVKMRVCPTVAAVMGDSPETQGCEPIKVLSKLEPCEEPKD